MDGPLNTVQSVLRWKNLWQLDALQKVKIFFWKVLSNILPVRARLITKGVVIDYQCPICASHEESSIHLLFMCPFARQVWSLSPFSQFFNSAPMDSIESIFDECLLRLTKDHIELLIFICWGIWGARNDWVWRNERTTVEQGLTKARNMVLEYQRAKQSRNAT